MLRTALAHAPRRFPTRKEIADRVKEIREAQRDPRMSRKDLAVKAKINIWAYYKKEKGGAPFSTDELERIADLFEAPMLWPLVTWREGLFLQRIPGHDK
jgi:hypothetical protein